MASVLSSKRMNPLDLWKENWSASQATENHCTSVNFPLVSPPAREGRMAARLLKYAVLYVFVNERTRGRAGDRERGRGRETRIFTNTHERARVPRKFDRSVHLHARLFPISDIPSFRIPSTMRSSNNQKISHHFLPLPSGSESVFGHSIFSLGEAPEYYSRLR